MTMLAPRQMRLFAERVATLSKGCVVVPVISVPLTEAKALWQSLVIAFPRGGSSGPAVSELEARRFARFVSRRSLGAIAGWQLPAMARCEMMALVAAAQRIAGWKQRFEARGALPRLAMAGSVTVAAMQLAACSTLLGGNIKGNFSCSAPNGTCAPSTVIDDQALAVIQNARPMTPAGPYFQPPADARQRSGAVAAAERPVAVADNGLVHRDRRVLRVVFPSYVDGRGNVHEPRIVHTVVDRGGWMQVSQGSQTAAEQVIGAANADDRTAAGAVRVGALEPAALAPVDLQGWSLTPPGGQEQGPVMGAPKAAAVEAARLRGASSVDPIQNIRSQVQARLGSVSPLPAGSSETAPKPPAPADAVPSPRATGSAAGAAAGPVNPPASFPAKVEE